MRFYLRCFDREAPAVGPSRLLNCFGGTSSTARESIQRVADSPAEAPEIGLPNVSGKYDDGVESAFQFHGAIAEAIASGRWLVAPVLVERGRREELAGGRGWAE